MTSLLLALSLLFSGTASAQSCGVAFSPETTFSYTDAVFLGTVTGESNGVVSVATSTIWKGLRVLPTVTVKAEGLSKGSEFIFSVNGRQGKYTRADACGTADGTMGTIVSVIPRGSADFRQYVQFMSSLNFGTEKREQPPSDLQEAAPTPPAAEELHNAAVPENALPVSGIDMHLAILLALVVSAAAVGFSLAKRHS